ncbi:VirB4-like conjugal transfer ATPase, CD1110 family [Schaedlerella sp.]|uniref:VirB4-like conjugal transfer ATPase, CD1110 family n=1 Tax=Schaedlerella sp. TaxID=2676057 RepID=UPI003747764C
MSIFSDRFEQLKRSDKPVKAPKYLQEVMGFQRISREGIFEVVKGRYSRTYRFQDINYVTAGTEDQMEILKQYCKTVNAIDVSFKITVNNRNKNMQEFRENVLFQRKGDGFDWIREAYNRITESRIVEGKQGIEQERYLTVCVERKGYEQAKAFFATFEATLKQNFAELGSTIEPLDAKERLRILFNFYRMGDEEQFRFNFRACMKRGGDAKNSISAGYMRFYPNYFETDRKKCRALFIKKYPASLPDTFINEITSLPVHSMTTIDIVPVPKELTNALLQKKYLGIENDILKQQRVRNRNHDFSSDISYIKKVQKEKIEGVMDDVRENDQNLFYVGVNMVVMADTKEDLDSITETLRNMGNGRMCQIEPHHYQQMEALNTVLPVGNRQVSTLRTMLTRDIAALLPFNVQELNEQGICYGINQVSHNLCIADRKNLANGNGMVFGIPGSGKSYFSKSEMLQVFLGTEDDIIVIDPTLEYFDIAEALGEQAAIVNLSTYTKNYINPLEMDVDSLDLNDSNGQIRDKGEFMLGLCEQCYGDSLNSRHKSIIDRCVRKLYTDIARSREKHIPTMTKFYSLLMEQPEPEAKDIALALELFVNGSLNIFNNHTNVNVQARFLVYGTRDLGKELGAISTLVMLENISARIAENAKKGKATWLFIDEFHTVLDKEYSAKYLYTLWKKVRKLGGLCTGITQNITDMLQNYTAVTMLGNSEFIALLKQANVDSQELSRVAGIPEAQLRFVNNSPSGTGIIKHGSVCIPFDNRMGKEENPIYALFNTNLHEKAVVHGPTDYEP